MKVLWLLILVYHPLNVCEFSFVHADDRCGEGAFLFDNECYLHLRGNCPYDSVYIRDKCCRENCVRSCTAPNCWHCCENVVHPVANIQLNQNAIQTDASRNQCCGQSTNCTSCSNSCTGSSCNMVEFQQKNACCWGSRSTCNQCGRQQTKCDNVDNGVPYNQCGNQQKNCCNNGSTAPCDQGSCQQTKCCNVGNVVSRNQCGSQQTNCNSGQCETLCKQYECPQIASATSCNQTTRPQNICSFQFCNSPFTPTISTTPIPYTYTTPPPATIQCPSGTVPIGRTCRPIYCPKGTIMRNNECIVITCPESSVWNGHKCVVPKPITQIVTFYNTIITQSNGPKPDISLNSYNNFSINLPVDVQQSSICNRDSRKNAIDAGTEENADCNEMTEPPPASSKCCTIMTPRTCELRNNHWHCYSRRYKRCGDFCTTLVIYLKPPRAYAKRQYVVMPPLHMNWPSGEQSCRHSTSNAPMRTGRVDCSGCVQGDMQRCSNYCYRYACPSQSCGFYDQQRYCVNNPASNGCMEYDGCFDNEWCS